MLGISCWWWLACAALYLSSWHLNMSTKAVYHCQLLWLCEQRGLYCWCVRNPFTLIYACICNTGLASACQQCTKSCPLPQCSMCHVPMQHAYVPATASLRKYLQNPDTASRHCQPHQIYSTNLRPGLLLSCCMFHVGLHCCTQVGPRVLMLWFRPVIYACWWVQQLSPILHVLRDQKRMLVSAFTFKVI